MRVWGRVVAMGMAFWLGALPAMAANEWVTCDPANVTTFTNRIHIKCSTSVAGGVRYFAREITNDADSARFLSMIIAAQVAGRTVQVWTDLADTSGSSFGCQVSDCRLLKAVSFGN